MLKEGELIFNQVVEREEAIERLQELVEKTTPKKVVETYDWRVTICPNCEEPIEADVEYYSRVYAKKGKETYCICCGQVLDWSAKGELDD